MEFIEKNMKLKGLRTGSSNCNLKQCYMVAVDEAHKLSNVCLKIFPSAMLWYILLPTVLCHCSSLLQLSPFFRHYIFFQTLHHGADDGATLSFTALLFHSSSVQRWCAV